MVLRCSRAKQRQGNIQKTKKCAAREVVYLLIGSVVFVFYRFCCFRLVYGITQFYIFFEQTINIKESFSFSPG